MSSKRNRRILRMLISLAIGTLFLMVATGVFGQDEEETPEEDTAAEVTDETAAETVEEVTVDSAAIPATLADVETVQTNLDATWVLLAGFLVFFMQAGFAFLEAGMIRQSGALNSMAENFFDAMLTGVAFWAIGFGIAYGKSNGLFGTNTFFFMGMDSDGANLDGALYVSYFYQYAFAAAAGTIITGATAERMNFWGKILYTIIIAAFIYPVIVHWVWSGSDGSFLYNDGYRDFAGSSVVHMVGGILALLGAIFIGPRAGREWGNPPKPHNMIIATLGTFILWFGWYGFNVGSTLNAQNPGLMGLVALNTTIAAATGSMAAMFFVYFRNGRWDVPAILNGSLAGLVGITAGCAYVSPVGALFIGVTAGVAVILALDVVERSKIDDAVGAFAVHGVCGALGTLAIGFWGLPVLLDNGMSGLFVGGGLDMLIQQAVGVAVIGAYVTVTGIIMWSIVKALGIMRIPAKAEEMGIDAYEHGASVWPDVLPLSEEAGASHAAGD